MPHSYDAVLILVNDGIVLFEELIEAIGERKDSGSKKLTVPTSQW